MTHKIANLKQGTTHTANAYTHPHYFLLLLELSYRNSIKIILVLRLSRHHCKLRLFLYFGLPINYRYHLHRWGHQSQYSNASLDLLRGLLPFLADYRVRQDSYLPPRTSYHLKSSNPCTFMSSEYPHPTNGHWICHLDLREAPHLHLPPCVQQLHLYHKLALLLGFGGLTPNSSSSLTSSTAGSQPQYHQSSLALVNSGGALTWALLVALD